MKILVAYSSRTGFTKGIAGFIAERLSGHGLEVDLSEVGARVSLERYDGFVVGSAVYMGHWTKEAKKFLSDNRSLIGARPTWLFSSGPVGTSRTDAKGRDLLEVSGPKEIEELRKVARPRDHRVFFGGLDGAKMTGATGFMYHLVTKSKAARESMPEGDFRDWKEIGGWADGIAEALLSHSAPATP